jgi:hypothetical protein
MASAPRSFERATASRFGIDEQAATNSGRADALDSAPQPVRIVSHVEAPFGRDFLTPLGHDRGFARTKPNGEIEDLVGQRHLEVERSRFRDEQLDVRSWIWRRSSRR